MPVPPPPVTRGDAVPTLTSAMRREVLSLRGLTAMVPEAPRVVPAAAAASAGGSRSRSLSRSPSHLLLSYCSRSRSRSLYLSLLTHLPSGSRALRSRSIDRGVCVRGAEGGDGASPVEPVEDRPGRGIVVVVVVLIIVEREEEEGEEGEEGDSNEDVPLCSTPARARSNSAELAPRGALPLALVAADRVSMMVGMPPCALGTMAKSLPRITGCMPSDCVCLFFFLGQS